MLALVGPGYSAMAAHIPKAGVFYAFAVRLGRPAGVAAALMALVAYSFPQIGLRRDYECA